MIKRYEIARGHDVVIGSIEESATGQLVLYRDVAHLIEPVKRGHTAEPVSSLYQEVLTEIAKEAHHGFDIWGPFNSAHEAFGVLHEEFDELKAHVWMNQRKRDLPAMRKEAVQVAAMALRFITEVCDEERGRR